MEKQTLLTDLQDKFKACVESETWRTFITNGTNDFEFREGIQWSTAEIADLKKRGQPATVENEIKPIVDRINGFYTQQKTRIIYKGRNLGKDEKSADVLSALALHVQQQTGYEFEEGEMFDDGQSCGFGVMEVSAEYGNDLSPEIKFKAENCLNIFPDPNSKNYNWNEDAEYICRAKWVSFNRAKQLYPEYKNEIEAYINTNPVVNDSQTMERNHLIDIRLKRIRLIEVWYKEWVKRKFAVGVGIGGVVEITGWKAKQISELKKISDIKFHDKVEAKIKMGLFCGDVLLEDKDSPYEHNLFPFIPYFVSRRKNGEPYSVVRMLKDQNMEINKRRSKALHLLNTNQIVFEEGGVRDEDELKTEAAKPDGIIKYRKGFKFEILKNIELAASQLNLQSESKSSIARVSGIPELRSSEVRSGIGKQREQMRDDVGLASIFGNLRRTRLLIGNIMLELIRQFYTEQKVFSVLDDMNQTKEFMLSLDNINSIRDNSYDVIIEEAPNTTTIQEEQFAYLAELVKGLPMPANVGIALLPIFIRLSQVKNKEEIIKLIEQLQQIPPERPKTSLSLVWSELYPEEKAVFAQMMGMDDLAQFEMQAQPPPKQEVNKPNPEIELANAQIGMEMESQKHNLKMKHEHEKHIMNMGHKQDEQMLANKNNE